MPTLGWEACLGQWGVSEWGKAGIPPLRGLLFEFGYSTLWDQCSNNTNAGQDPVMRGNTSQAERKGGDTALVWATWGSGHGEETWGHGLKIRSIFLSQFWPRLTMWTGTSYFTFLSSRLVTCWTVEVGQMISKTPSGSDTRVYELEWLVRFFSVASNRNLTPTSLIKKGDIYWR